MRELYWITKNDNQLEIEWWLYGHFDLPLFMAVGVNGMVCLFSSDRGYTKNIVFFYFLIILLSIYLNKLNFLNKHLILKQIILILFNVDKNSCFQTVGNRNCMKKSVVFKFQLKKKINTDLRETSTKVEVLAKTIYRVSLS